MVSCMDLLTASFKRLAFYCFVRHISLLLEKRKSIPDQVWWHAVQYVIVEIHEIALISYWITFSHFIDISLKLRLVKVLRCVSAIKSTRTHRGPWAVNFLGFQSQLPKLCFLAQHCHLLPLRMASGELQKAVTETYPASKVSFTLLFIHLFNLFGD